LSCSRSWPEAAVSRAAVATQVVHGPKRPASNRVGPMKAAVIYGNGGPDVLRYEDVPDPERPEDRDAKFSTSRVLCELRA
jgi:hypothetical protein